MSPLLSKIGADPLMDVYTLSFRDRTGDLYHPNSTYMGGRNALLRLALSREWDQGYEYFLFVDEVVVKDVW